MSIFQWVITKLSVNSKILRETFNLKKKSLNRDYYITKEWLV
tara:strand:+ start:1159 stop:1284 length:126 start_codon:yes stop_codon:yes gene_type:complete